MKAAVLRKLGAPLEITDVPRPTLDRDEVLVRTHTCGICRTDLHIQDGLAYVPALPHIPGHEPAGVVVEVGSEVKDVKVGQRVVPHLFVRGGECRFSRAGHDAQALDLKGIVGVTLPGGFAEYFKAPARNLLPLPEQVPFEIGGLTSCAAITAVHAFHKGNLQAGDSAAVLGVGGIGLIMIQLLKAAGVRVLAVDRSQASFPQARAAGADEVALVEELGPGNVDCVFELVGRAETMRTAATLVRRAGTIVVVGEEAEFPAIDTVQIAQRELRIIGSRNGGMQDAREALAKMASGVIRPVIAATVPLENINAALDMVRRGEAVGRVVVRVRV
jgi:propanol-preferring alcohol dehydrogenase